LIELFGRPLCQLLIVISAIKLAWEAAIFRHLLWRRMTSLRRSALLMAGELSSVTLARFAAGLLGGVLMPVFLLSHMEDAVHGTGFVQFVVTTGLLFVACLVGELLERYLFFAACAAPKMPGGIR
jgi:uncharacterized membrane protein YdjX (TVP38/TMEM64 family)